MRQLDFSQEKIVSPQRSYANTFAYNNVAWVASMDVYFITQNDSGVSLKYILSLLNSKLYYFWLYHKGKRKGEMLELYQTPLSEIPINFAPREQQRPLIALVDRILAAKLRNPAADTSAFESEIDELVFDAYQLTSAERAHVNALADQI